MDWFERLTGFQEINYAETRRRLSVEGQRLRSLVNGRSYAIGELELVSLAQLRARIRAAVCLPGTLRVRNTCGDIRRIHQDPAFTGALFQVASQFNLLEMVSPAVSPDDGVTIYERDRTQGPACAIAAGAATIYRNYFAPVGDQQGQTADRQIDALADVGSALRVSLGMPMDDLWQMRNGYALCTRTGLDAITRHLAALSAEGVDVLRGKLRIGIHHAVEVTDGEPPPGHRVTQAFCSALPVAYGPWSPECWRPFATLILESAYEASLLATACNAQRGGSAIALLTRLGGGAFGNEDAWIDAALRRALQAVRHMRLDVHLVSYGPPGPGMLGIAAEFA